MDDPIRNLFGSPVNDLRSMLEHLHSRPDLPVEAVPPGFSTPHVSSADLFYACWRRFHYLKDLGQLAAGQPRKLPERLTALHVPGVQAHHFGSRVVNTFRSLANLSDPSLLQTPAGGAPTLHLPRELLERVPADHLLNAWIGMYATPFFMDDTLSAAVLASQAPSPQLLSDLRLPVPHALVVLGAAFEVGPDSGWWGPEDIDAAQASDELLHRMLDDLDLPPQEGLLDMYRSQLTTMFLTQGGAIRGVVFSADDNGFLHDHVIWLIEADRDHPDGAAAGIVVGTISGSTLAPLLHNLASIVAWGPWQAPKALSPVPDDAGDLAAAAKKGWLRKAARHPENLGVHVIDRDRTQARAGTGEDTGRSLRPHLRCGHWRSVRVATRDPHGRIVGSTAGTAGVDWHYEGRWVPPVVVNAHRDTPLGERVYRLPSRHEFEQATGSDRVRVP